MSPFSAAVKIHRQTLFYSVFFLFLPTASSQEYMCHYYRTCEIYLIKRLKMIGQHTRNYHCFERGELCCHSHLSFYSCYKYVWGLNSL